MPNVDDIRQVKRAISSKLLGVSGVAGVGLPGGVLTVYLECESPALRSQITQMVKELAPDTKVEFLVTGTFQAQG
jgi:hypothetical protein